MKATLTTKRLVAVLSKVPEKRFRMADLAPELIDATGKVDVAKALDKQGELNLAIVEVETYVRGAKDLRRSIECVSGSKDELTVDDVDLDDDPEAGE